MLSNHLEMLIISIVVFISWVGVKYNKCYDIWTTLYTVRHSMSQNKLKELKSSLHFQSVPVQKQKHKCNSNNIQSTKKQDEGMRTIKSL